MVMDASGSSGLDHSLVRRLFSRTLRSSRHRQHCFAWCPSSCLSVLVGFVLSWNVVFLKVPPQFFSYSRQGGDRNPVVLFSPSSPLGPRFSEVS